MEDMNFEKALARLEEIVARLEGGNLALEQTLEIFEEGIQLFRRCEHHLQQAEGRVMKITANLDAGLEITPLED